MERFSSLAGDQKAKVHFIHLNHTNPALMHESQARKEILEKGFQIAEELQRIEL
jgi:pyrroloquinoline quinone biosynthesis protein B